MTLSTSSLTGAGSVSVTGDQDPRYQFAPPSVGNAAPEVIDLMDQIGMPLDPWQRTCMWLMLGERPDGLWAAFEFGLIVARQNGKGGVLEAREMGGLFLFGERRIIHSAHEADTAAEAFQRMRNLIDGTAWLSKRVRKINASPGKQRIELMSGQVLSYRTRTNSGGRGFSAPTIILDEAQNLDPRQIAALMPVASAQPNPQLVYAGTVLAGASVFRGVVERGRKQVGSRLGYAEWSSDEDCDPSTVEAWQASNPSLGIRITLDYVQSEYESLTAAGALEQFRQERLSIWPEADQIGSLITVEDWAKCEHQFSRPDGVKLAMGVAVSPDRSRAAVGYAWERDGVAFVDVVPDLTVDQVLPYLVERAQTWEPVAIGVDQGGPAGTLLVAMGAAHLPARTATTVEWKTACAQFVDRSKLHTIRHRGIPELTIAANGVREHKVGDSFVYARRDSRVDVSPLEAVTAAVWALSPDPKQKEVFVMNLAKYLDEERK